ncbi:MAG: GNAT family N-acetyltransferase [Solirubrobacteraceae bacterium]
MPSIPQPPTPWRDGPVLLRLATERDIPDILIAHQDDHELHRCLGLARAPSGAELGSAAERAPAARAAGTQLTLTIVDPDTEECWGQIDVHPLDWDHGRAQLRAWVAPRARNQGLARRALRLTAGWLLGLDGLQRVQLIVDSGNASMVRCARAAGFHHEGLLRGYWREPGRARRRVGARLDAAIMSLLPGDLQA